MGFSVQRRDLESGEGKIASVFRRAMERHEPKYSTSLPEKATGLILDAENSDLRQLCSSRCSSLYDQAHVQLRSE